MNVPYITKLIKWFLSPLLYAIPAIGLVVALSRAVKDPISTTSIVVALTGGYVTWFFLDGRRKLEKLQQEKTAKK